MIQRYGRVEDVGGEEGMKATSLNVLIKMTETYFVFLLYRKKREGLKLFNAVISEMLNAVDSIAAKNPGINSLSAASPQLRNAAISNLGTSKSGTLTPCCGFTRNSPLALMISPALADPATSTLFGKRKVRWL